MRYIIAALALCCGSASADWQYTRWGMTADETIAASAGKLQRKNEGKAATFLVGTHTAAGVSLDVAAIVSPDQGLRAVVLSSQSRPDCLAVMNALTDRAPPEVQSRSPGGESLLWRDEEHGNLIRFTSNERMRAIPGAGDRPSCFIEYKPLGAPDDGL